MINATLLRANGKLTGFCVSGHAGQDEYGSDIVCSAVSALTQAAILGLTEAINLPGVEYAVEEGCLNCSCEQAAQHEGAQAILEAMALGLRSITGNYGKYLKIVEREV